MFSLTPCLLQVLQYGRKQSKLDGETEVLTLNLRSVGSVNHRIPQTLKVSVLLDERTDPDSFNFFVRNADDALLGLGSRDGKVVTISGSGGSGSADARGDLSTKQLRDHLEVEGFVYEHQALDQEKFQEEFKRAGQIENDRYNHNDRYNYYPPKPAEVVDGLTETSCFKTVASWLGLTVSFLRELTLEDYLDLNNYEGCLKPVEGICRTCGEYLGLMRFLEKSYANRIDREGLRKKKLNPKKCNGREGYLPVDSHTVELCSPKIQSALDYWNRQRRNYLPDCQLMLDRTSDPWRLSGICSHPTSSHAVEFEATPTFDFMYREEYSNKEDSYHSSEGYQQHYQHNYYSETNVFPDSFINLRKLKVYVGFGVTLLIVFFVFTRKFRGNSEEKRN
ncbi:hypothetical protein TrLO_g5361 [Triparma laevis f. longispina]|uniref:Uncharacterized protein n=1 Tax=Triparma laevis f. longispina TaxID=1714387 RepID=A0A9W7ABP4_9STRA|nr:hypothetical protein TrLO_g5361 [Triparma laevis f. longispina]